MKVYLRCADCNSRKLLEEAPDNFMINIKVDSELISENTVCSCFSEKFVEVVTDLSQHSFEEKKFQVVTLCGSMRFYERMLECAERFTRHGVIVLMPFVDKRNPIQVDHIMLRDMHFKKIEMADYVYIFNRDNYIGDSVREEIAYANKIGKRVVYLVVPKKEEERG